MAKDTPNTPDGEKVTPAEENLQAAPGGEPLAADSPAPGEVVVTAEKIAELDEERRRAAREAGASEEQTAPKRRGRPPRDKGGEAQEAGPSEPGEQTAEDKKAPEAPTPEEYKKRGQKAADTRKARRQGVDDFIEGKRTSPFPDGKPIPEKPPKATRAARPPKGPKEEAPAQEPEIPPEPKEAPRPEGTEEITFIPLSELFPFKDHPFQVRDDAEMRAMVESVKDKGVTQPAIVRPREGGGYEIVSGHRRQKASELAGFTDIPCIVRNLTDEQAITQMVEDNTNQRENILVSERAKALKMQLEAIKRQGARDNNGGNGQRSNEIVAQRNKMPVKTMQRFIKLNDLVPELLDLADKKAIGFIPAFEMAYIRPKNQQYIAVAIRTAAKGNRGSRGRE